MGHRQQLSVVKNAQARTVSSSVIRRSYSNIATWWPASRISKWCSGDSTRVRMQVLRNETLLSATGYFRSTWSGLLRQWDMNSLPSLGWVFITFQLWSTGTLHLHVIRALYMCTLRNCLASEPRHCCDLYVHVGISSVGQPIQIRAFFLQYR